MRSAACYLVHLISLRAEEFAIKASLYNHCWSEWSREDDVRAHIPGPECRY